MNEPSSEEEEDMLTQSFRLAREIIAALNLACCFSLAVWILMTCRFRRGFYSRIVVYLSLANALLQVSFLMGSPRDDTLLCMVQSLWMMYFSWSLVLWTTCVACCAWLLVEWRVCGSRAQEIISILVSTFAPLGAVIPMAIWHVWGQTNGYCWVEPSKPWWIMGSFYIPLVAILGVVVMAWMRSECLVRRIAREELSAGVYERKERRTTQVIRNMVKRSRVFLAVFVAVWSISTVHRISQAIGIPLSEIVAQSLRIATLPLYSVLSLISWWFCEGEEKRTASLLTRTRVAVVSTSGVFSKVDTASQENSRSGLLSGGEDESSFGSHHHYSTMDTDSTTATNGGGRGDSSSINRIPTTPTVTILPSSDTTPLLSTPTI